MALSWTPGRRLPKTRKVTIMMDEPTYQALPILEHAFGRNRSDVMRLALTQMIHDLVRDCAPPPPIPADHPKRG